jgi:HAD superfamily hydrolase (TIGR01509 family)
LGPITTELQAVLWDVDGTIAETERDGHRIAFNREFAECGVDWHWSTASYGTLLEISGGYERILFDMQRRAEAPTDPGRRESLARHIHASQNQCYAKLVAERGLAARAGVVRLMNECRANGVALAVATTTGRGNVDALFPHLFGPDWQAHFAAIVCAEDAPAKKPDPSVYFEALQRLGIEADQAVAVEDSPNGLRSACGAQISTLVTPSAYFQDASFAGAAMIVPNLDAPAVLDGQSYGRTDLAVLRAIRELQTG